LFLPEFHLDIKKLIKLLKQIQYFVIVEFEQKTFKSKKETKNRVYVEFLWRMIYFHLFVKKDALSTEKIS
jgi:hypothetical protein